MKQSTEVLGVKIVGGLRETSTPWAGVSLLVDLFRHLGMNEVANKVLPAKKSSKGLFRNTQSLTHCRSANPLLPPQAVVVADRLYTKERRDLLLYAPLFSEDDDHVVQVCKLG